MPRPGLMGQEKAHAEEQTKATVTRRETASAPEASATSAAVGDPTVVLGSMDQVGQARLVTGLQRSLGNAAVQRLARRTSAVQRDDAPAAGEEGKGWEATLVADLQSIPDIATEFSFDAPTVKQGLDGGVPGGSFGLTTPRLTVRGRLPPSQPQPPPGSTPPTVQPRGGDFKVLADFTIDLSWDVQSCGRTNVSGPDDPVIDQYNYRNVADDLTPDASAAGMPPRTRFWSQDQTVAHELFHVEDYTQVYKGVVHDAQRWLSDQSASSEKEVYDLFVDMMGKLVQSANIRMGLDAEKRAYGSQIDAYFDMAEAVRRKGDTGGYERGSEAPPEERKESTGEPEPVPMTPEVPASPAPQVGSPDGPPPPAAGAKAGDALIVDDSVTDLQPGQLRRADFLGRARTSVTAAVEGALGPARASAGGELEQLFARYSGMSASDLEATVRGEVQAAGGATTAEALVAAVTEQAREEALARLAVDAEQSAADLLSAGASVLSAAASLLFKRRDGSAGRGADAGAVQSRLGRGRTLDGSVRGAMESAFGASLADVRVHDDAPSAALAGELGARAFTVGRHVAFGPGEYAPGTPVGDALVAHELAHVLQQRGSVGGPLSKDDGTSELEDDADRAAVGAVASRWPGVRGSLNAFGADALPRLKSGLRLQRCRTDPTKKALGEKVSEGMKEANKSGSPDKGVHYPFNYKRYWPDKWAALGSPEDGYADKNYWKRVGFMHWVRLGGKSASEAMDRWLGGPTIADCASTIVAVQLNTVRSSLGDDKFDEHFGGSGTKAKTDQLEISQSVSGSTLEKLMKEAESAKNPGTKGKRNVHPGEHHYFANHPDYPKRHPKGYWQGENAVYIGEDDKGVQRWSGFGAGGKSEEEMNAALVREYNAAPSEEEREYRESLSKKHGPDPSKWPPEVQKFGGSFVDEIDETKLLAAGGGFQGKAGQELDPAKVAGLRQ